MRRIAAGWQLAKQTSAVLRRERSLVWFPALAAALAAIVFAVLVAPGLALAAAEDDLYWALPFALVAAYAATFVALYVNVALTAAVAGALDGRAVRMRDGFAVARERRGVIARWALVAVTVGAVLRALSVLATGENPVARIVAQLAIALAGAAWAVATFLVLPVLAFEGLGPLAALKRSTDLVRTRWREGAVGGAAITAAVLLLALLPAAALIAVAVATGGTVAVIAGTLAAIVLIVAAVVGSALGAIFRVVVYRFAQGGATTPGFETVAAGP